MKIKKILGSLILGIYLASDILGHLGYIDWNVAEAATSGKSTNPIVAILIDNETYNTIGSNGNFKRYTDSYIPEKYPGSESIIFSLDLKEYTAPEIVKLLENVYFDGIKNTSSRLIGVIVMGKVPLPVVKYQNYIFPSIYPYTDFIEQKYIWDETQGYFIQNKTVGEAEIWHGLISLDDASKYDKFFTKLKKYQKDPEKFIDKKIWYDDFIALNKNFLQEIYQLYKNKVIFAEDLIYHRYTNFLVDMLQVNQQNENAEVLGDLQKAMAELDVHIPEVETAKQDLLNNQTEFTPTLLLQQKIDSFLKDYHEAISTTLLKTIDDNIKAGDRWTVNDSHYQKIQIKDQLLYGNEEANGIFKSVNDKLEKYVDDKIAKEKYAMKVTIPIYYQRWKDRRKRFLWIKRYVPEYKDTYEFYYFGKNARTINDPKDFSIYRGTYRNLDHFVNYSSIIGDSLNPSKTNYDSTDLTKRGIGSSYDLFSTQVEANRGYNILNMETEYDTYIAEKRHARLEEGCRRYWFGISFFGCREREWEPDGTCEKGSEDPDEIADCETFPDFGNRVRGGATPLNLEMDKYQKQIYEFKGKYEYRNAIKPIFDIAGSVKITNPEPKATSYDAATEYISPILMADKGGSLIRTDLHTAYTDAWYFKLPLYLLNDDNFKKNSSNEFTIKKEKRSNTDEELTYMYRIIPSVIKHDSTQEAEINGYSGYRYDENSDEYAYYQSIMQALDSAKDDGYSTEVNKSMSDVKDTIAKLIQKIRGTDNYEIGCDTGKILTGIKELNPEILKALVDIGTQTNGQLENWRKFNAIFGNNYGATVESLVEGFKQHQIDLDSPIDIRSKRYNEILSKISQVARDLEALRSVAKGVFNNYNSVFAMIEATKDAVQKKIDEVQKIIDELTEKNEELKGKNAELTEEISENTTLIGEKQGANATEEQNLKTLEERQAKEIKDRNDKADLKTQKESLLKEKEDAFAPDKDKYDELISGQNALLKEKDTLTGRQKELNDAKNVIDPLNDQIKELLKEIASYDNSNGQYTTIINQKKDEIKKKQDLIDKKKKEVNSTDIEGDLKKIADRLKEINQELTKIKNDLAPYEPRANEIKNLKDEIEKLQQEIDKYDKEILPGTQKDIDDCKARMGENSGEITAAQNTIKENEGQIETNNQTIEENEKIIEEATVIRDEWIEIQGKIQQLERKVEVGLNILEKCTANHSVLGNILDMDESLIHYGDESNECEDDENPNQQGGAQGDADDVITVLIDELNTAKTAFKNNFNSDPKNPVKIITGMNLLTQDRPIDSPRYVSFQGIGEHVIKLIYPDIFKVEVYKSGGKGLILKDTDPENAKNEIYNALKKYFQNKVYEYNTILKNEYDNAKTVNKYYSYILRVDPLGTPDKGVRPYGYFTYDEMIKTIGGDEMLYTLAELLYYQSVSNHIREYFDNIGEDINETRATFDINKKIGYIMGEYLKEDNDKIYRGEKIEGKDIKGERKSYAGLVIPTYSTGGYEVGYINSNGADNIAPDVDDIDITLKGGQSATRSLTADELGENGYDDEPGDDEASQDIEKDCGYDPNEPLSLFDGSRFKGLACWLKAVAKKPVTVKVYFQTSPTISSISEPLEQTWDDYKNSFKSTIDGYADMPKSSENMSTRTQDMATSTQITWNDNKVNIVGKTGSLNFLSFKDLGDIIVKVQSTGDNCLIINGINTCGGTATVSKNPYKKGFSLDYTLGKETIGNVVANISICSTADNCAVRNMSLSVVPGPVATFKIETTTDNQVLAGTYTLLNIIALDSKGNEISRTLEKYYVKVNKGTLFINGEAKTTQEINDFVTSTMLYRAEKGTSGTVTVTVEDAKGKVMGKNTITIFPGDLKLNDKDTEQIKYQVSDEKYYNDDGSINTKKAIPIKLTLKNGGQIVKITSNVAFDSKNKLAKIMVADETKDDKGNKKIKLRQANSLMIEKGERTVYLVPGYKAGNDEITVTVPGLDPKKILLKVEPGEMKNIGVTLENDIIYPKDTLKGEVELTDARGNKIEKTTTISVKSTSELKVSPSEEPSVAQGSRKFTLPTTEDDVGLHKISIKGKSSDGKEISASKRFTVKNFFLKGAIESGLNIMYLNLFGNDWGNQWGYNSDNKKFAENIIQKSSKTLAVTTQLIAPSKIQETAIIFGKDGNIQNLGGVKLKATLDNSKLKINVNNVGDFTINDGLEKIIAIESDVSNERIENAIKNETSKVIYLFDIDEEYTYDGGIFLNDKGEEFADMRNGIDFELGNYNLATKPVWNISYKGKQLASAIITKVNYSNVSEKIEGIGYELGEIFDRGSTESKVKALLSTTNTLEESYQGYDSIQNSDELNKYIGFRADFKNITLFAEGESVGEATIPFGSEFLINIGDPLLKNRDEVASKRGLGQVKFSEPGKSIFKVTDIDYNGDGLRDLIVIYRDGSISLIKQYSNNKYEEMGTLMISAEQIDEVFVGDVDGNGYEDIIIKNGKNQMRAYTNTDGVFDVDGNVVCLNVNTKAGQTNPEPGNLSGVVQLFIEDMDNDGRADIVTLDKKGYLKITYGNGTKSRHSYLSKDVYDCDKNRLERQEGSTKIIKKFGVKLTSNGISDDSILRWSDLRYPGNDEIEKEVINGKLDADKDQTDLEKQGIYIPQSEIDKWKSGNISEDDIAGIVGYMSDVNTTEQAQKASEAASVYIKNPFVGKYLDIDSLNDSGIAFISMYNIEKFNSLTNTKKVNKPTKSFIDKNGGELDDGDEVEVTVTITTNGVKLSEYFDKISGPWIVDRDPNTGAPKDLKFTYGTGKIIQGMVGYDFGIVDIKGSSGIAGGGALQFKYTLKYHLENPIYTIKIVREKPLSTISVLKAEEDTTILRWNGLKYEEKNKDILIKNPFGTRFKINDGLNNGEQAYINLNDIVSYINRTNSKEVYVMEKNYKDLNGGSLDNGDPVEVRVTIPLPKSHANINAILEDIKGPWNESGLPKSFQFTKGTGTVKSGINGYDFNITNITPISNGDEYIFEYKYTLTFKETTNTNTDNLPSIIVQPIDGCIKKEEVLKNNTQDKNRAYDSELVDLQELADTYAKQAESKNAEATQKINAEIAGSSKNGTDNSTILNSIKEKFTIEDMLKEVWGKVLENNGLNFGNIDLDITKIMGVDLKKMEKDLQKYANSLCHGFTFGTEGGTKTCEGLPVPFNQAFLAPGNYHIMGCIPLEPLTQTLGSGLPVFHFPGTLITPVGTIPIPWGLKSPSDDFLWVGGGTYPSIIRIYAAPTLTAQVGIAICLGLQKVGLNIPSPVSDVGGNCIVTAIALPCPSGGGGAGDDGEDGDDNVNYEDWVGEYGSTSLCNPQDKESPFTMIASDTLNSKAYPTSPKEGPYLGGLINIDYDPINSYSNSSSFGDSDAGIEINGVKIQGAKDISNKLLGGIQQGVQKILVDWIDRQVQYWINNLLRFEIQFTFPDITYLSEEINKIGNSNIQNLTNKSAEDNKKEIKLARDATKGNKKARERMEKQIKTVSDKNISKGDIKKLNLAEGANPFKELQDLFNETELINITTQNVPIRIPRIYSEDIEAYGNYLLTWYEDNSTVLKGWEATLEAAIHDCDKKSDEDKSDPKRAAHCKLVRDSKAKLMKLTNKFDKIGKQIFQNVQTLEAYKRFPLQIYEWLHVTDKYLGDISALIGNFFGYINFWMDVNANRFSQYCDAIITIVTIVKTYQVMIDLFVDWGAKCGKCTQDTYDQYSCKLSFLCNAFEIPTIPIPSVKIPSLYIDLSHFNLQMNIRLPRFKFIPQPVELPRLPNLPQPPELGVNFNIDFDIPDIPQLPQPPELPELPSFIPQVKLELPILPPAPEIPEIPNKITGLLKVAKTLSKIYCIVKSGIGVVGEKSVKARIEQMTQRSYEVPRVDNLDLTLYFKQTPLQGIDIAVDSFVNLQYNFDAFYALLKSIVDPINQATYSLLQETQNGVQYLEEKGSEPMQNIDRVTNQNIILKAEISKTNTPDKMKEQLYELRDTLLNAQDKERVNQVIAYASTDTKVEKNDKGINKIEEDLNKLIEGEKENVIKLADLAKDDYDGFLDSIKNRKEDSPYQLTYKTNLLNRNAIAEEVIANSNAMEMFIETEDKKVEGYYSALKNHTAEELNMSEETYENSIKYMASIKDKINQWYSIKRNEYEGTTTLIDDEGKKVSRTLLTTTSNTTPSKNEASTNDYSQYVQGIYIKDGEKTISAVNSEYNYKKFLGYYERDLDNDGKNELVMWDNYNVFIKYFEKGNTKGKGSVVVKPTLKKESRKQYLSLGGLFSDEIKVYDENAEVKNFMLKGQNFDSISFTWDNNPDEAKSGYLMRLVERVDGYRERNSQSKVKYILFLPNGMEEEIDDLRIQIQGTTQKIKSLLGDKIYAVKYYNPALETIQFSLPEVPRKWQYVQITTIKLKETVYQQNAPWSNQLVGGRQAIGDGEPPKARVELERIKKNNEVVDDGFDLEGYVGTYYNLRITWYDETKVRVTQLIEMDSENDTGKVLNEKDFDNFMGIVLLPDLFFTEKQKKVYKITAIDSQGNETEETIQLEIQVPGISIEDITRNDGYKDGMKGPISIISELETDIDKGDVSFERFRNNGTTPITATEGGEGKLTYPVTTNQTKVTGQYYDYGDTIGLYTKDNKQIANVNGENGEIELKGEFAGTVKPRVDLSQGYPTVKLMEGDNPLFEIIIQPEKLVKTEVFKGQLIKLEGGNYGAFDGGSVIMKDGKAILYIGPTGVLYTTENLQGDYIFNKSDETITYEIYEAFGDKIASITFKAKPLE